MNLPILQGRLKGKRWVVGAGDHAYWLGTYEHEKTAEFAKRLRRGDVVLDIGAHVGYYTLLAATSVRSEGRVVSVEPLQRNVQYLKRHIELNQLSNVTVIQAAVSDAPGPLEFAQDANTYLGRVQRGGGTTVDGVTIDECVLERCRLDRVNVIKLDVEGAEGCALRGAEKVLKQFRPVIFLATHGLAVHEECLQLLRGHGYEVRLLDPSGRQADELLAVHAESRSGAAA
jgi:FkbM family methyltransferase